MMPEGQSAAISNRKSLAIFITRHAKIPLFFCLLLIVIRVFLMPALSPSVLGRMMETPARLDSQWATQDNSLLAETLSAYLSSSADSAQAQVHVGGETVPAFQTHELQHLQDVRNLFSLSFRLAAGAVLALFVVSLIVLTSKGNSLRARAKTLASALQSTAIGVLGILGLVALLAVTRFEQAFYAMHQLLFTNDLWLLDPKRDVLIQLMPQRFFTDYALYAVKPVLAFLGILLLVSNLMRAMAAGALKNPEVEL